MIHPIDEISYNAIFNINRIKNLISKTKKNYDSCDDDKDKEIVLSSFRDTIKDANVLFLESIFPRAFPDINTFKDAVNFYTNSKLVNKLFYSRPEYLQNEEALLYLIERLKNCKNDHISFKEQTVIVQKLQSYIIKMDPSRRSHILFKEYYEDKPATLTI